MTPWSLDYAEFAALCEQLLGGPQSQPQPPRPRGHLPAPEFRGLWFRYGAASDGASTPTRRGGLRRGYGFPRGGR
jgi:hypothetical protein